MYLCMYVCMYIYNYVYLYIYICMYIIINQPVGDCFDYPQSHVATRSPGGSRDSDTTSSMPHLGWQPKVPQDPTVPALITKNKIG